MSLLRIEKLEVYLVTGPATIWSVCNGQQDTIYATVASGSTQLLGPYLNITTFNVDGGSTQKVFSNFSTPVKLLDYIGTDVVNVTPGTDITVNAGNVLNQRIGYKDNTEGCGSDNVALNASGCTIDGETSFTLDADGQYVELVWDGVSNWRLA